MRLRLAFLLLPLVVSCSGGGGSSGPPSVSTEHPFLVVRPADLPDLRARSNQSPWRELAEEAKRYAVDEAFDPTASPFQAKTRMTDLCGALALAYVLDPSPVYVDKLEATLNAWEDYFQPTAPGGSVTGIRWQQSAMVQSIFALDVMGAGLGDERLQALEARIDVMIGQWWANLPQDGTTSTPGITALWALYEGDRARFESARDLYFERLFGELTPSGVYESGGGYAWVRYGGDRISKYALLDVLAFTGEDGGHLDDPRLATLGEWMFGGALTPRRTNLTFGDADPSRPIEPALGYTPAFRAIGAGTKAGRNAAWVVRDVTPRPLLSTFAVLEAIDGNDEAPTSGIWGDSATFWESPVSPTSLLAALWSPRSSGGHSHKDVNAVHLFAYGENVLRNAGYCGSGVGVNDEFDWDWIFSTAASSNTVSVGGADHASKVGGGILEGFTASGFDYAASDSGPALGAGNHLRSLVLIHGEAGAPGYFVLFDEVTTPAVGTEIGLDLHPDSSDLAAVLADTEFGASVASFGSTPVDLRIVLGTPPESTEVRDGGLCAFDDGEYVGRYLHGTYRSDALREGRMVTVLFPVAEGQTAPGIVRLDGGGLFTGVRVTYPSGVEDVAAEADGSSFVVLGPQAFRGRALHLRTREGDLESWFVRRGQSFDDGAPQRTGFESDRDTSLFVRGTEANVTSDGATVTFYDPTLMGVAFDSPVGTVLGAGAGFVQIRLAPGTHAFDLATGATLR